MSGRGIRQIATVFAAMQNARQNLIHLGSERADTPEGQQDIRLGQLLKEAEDSVKEKFTAETLKPEAQVWN